MGKRCWSVLLVAALSGATSHAAAEPPKVVVDAWKTRDWLEAERLARRAIEDGNLAPKEVVDSYVYLGAARAMQNKKAPSLAAFRAAGALDADFLLPADVGPRAVEFANQARAEVASIGSISLKAQIPKKLEPHQTFTIVCTLDEAHVPIAKKIAIVAKDGTSGKSFEEEVAPGESVDFQVPMALTLPGAVIKVRIDALDRFRNRLASVEETIDVGGKPAAAAAPSAAVSREREQKKSKKGGGFWKSPWPYVIGGTLLLAAGGASAYYFWLRPPDDVMVGSPRVRPAN